MSPANPRAFFIQRIPRVAASWPTLDGQHLYLVGRRGLESTASSEALCRMFKFLDPRLVLVSYVEATCVMGGGEVQFLHSSSLPTPSLLPWDMHP